MRHTLVMDRGESRDKNKKLKLGGETVLEK